MKDDCVIKITICSHYTPNGRNIHGIGIEPNIICEFYRAPYYNTGKPIDNQLEKAKRSAGVAEINRQLRAATEVREYRKELRHVKSVKAGLGQRDRIGDNAERKSWRAESALLSGEP